MAFKEADLEKVFIDLLVQEGCKYVPGEAIARGEGEVLIEQDLRDYLHRRYDSEGITENEIRSVVLQLRSLSASALYESNKKFCSWLSDGFMLKRENPKDKDILIEGNHSGRSRQIKIKRPLNINGFIITPQSYSPIIESNQERILKMKSLKLLQNFLEAVSSA